MLDAVRSKSGASIRLTAERWSHIVEEHSEMAGRKHEVLDAVEHPDRILEAREGARIAMREHDPGRHTVVVYRETGAEGFIITAFTTSKAGFVGRRKQLWP